jgi:hypothetical protein
MVAYVCLVKVTGTFFISYSKSNVAEDLSFVGCDAMSLGD